MRRYRMPAQGSRRGLESKGEDVMMCEYIDMLEARGEARGVAIGEATGFTIGEARG